MTLPTGTRLGPYEVEGLLGVGGMGEVYRARDPRLGRNVAVKVLPTSFATDTERLRRFELEARAASALNHPAILTIHDFGLHEGAPYVVSELLEGQNLRERISGTPLAIRKAVDYAAQLARGLAAAHAKGIVHRDLKPENVFVTTDGRIKILDFGLAKLRSSGLPHDADSRTEPPTLGTEPGMILGTVGYMSPEQVRGLPADPRSDIFSFGAILYEMITGEQAFQRGSTVETLGAILKEEPRELSESSRIQPGLARVISHCLEKDPPERFQSASDIAFHLDTLSRASGSEPAATFGTDRRTPAWLFWGAAALCVLGTAGAGYGLATFRATPAPTDPVSVHRLTDFAGLEETPALSPDGRTVAFTAYVGDRRQVWVRLIAGGAALQLTRDDADHEAPRWAPDGASLVYYSPPAEGERLGTIWEVPALGGAPRRIASTIGGADVSHDGTRVAFFRSEENQVHLVVASRDGTASRVVARLPFENYYISPRWSPDDKTIAYQSGYVFTHDIFAVPAEGGTEPRRISREARLLSGFSWTPDGEGIVYSSARASTVLYLPTFNLWTARIDGSGLRQLTFGEVSYVEPDFAGGLLVTSRMVRSLDVWKFPVDGSGIENTRRGVQITRQTGQVQTPSVGSTDREVVYLSDSGGHGNLWITDTTTGSSRQLTYEQDPDVVLGVPVWSPDGRHIAFYATREGLGGNWLVNPDGGNPRELVRSGGWAAWSRDGRWLYYNENTQGSSAIGALKKIRPEGGPSITVRDDKGNRPAISPDGTRLYFVVERPAVSGGSDYEIRVASPENGPSRVLAQIPARRIPLWQLVHPVLSPDGRWLALPLTDGFATNIWALDTSDGSQRQLTDFGQRPTYIARRVSWSADGKAVYAALGDGDADVVLLRGLKP